MRSNEVENTSIGDNSAAVAGEDDSAVEDVTGVVDDGGGASRCNGASPAVKALFSCKVSSMGEGTEDAAGRAFICDGDWDLELDDDNRDSARDKISASSASSDNSNRD